MWRVDSTPWNQVEEEKKKNETFSWLSNLQNLGYELQHFVPEVHHRVGPHQRVHKVQHVVGALGTLLGSHLICDDVQTLVHLQRTEMSRQ